MFHFLREMIHFLGEIEFCTCASRRMFLDEFSAELILFGADKDNAGDNQLREP